MLFIWRRSIASGRWIWLKRWFYWKQRRRKKRSKLPKTGIKKCRNILWSSICGRLLTIVRAQLKANIIGCCSTRSRRLTNRLCKTSIMPWWIKLVNCVRRWVAKFWIWAAVPDFWRKSWRQHKIRLSGWILLSKCSILRAPKVFMMRWKMPI